MLVSLIKFPDRRKIALVVQTERKRQTDSSRKSRDPSAPRLRYYAIFTTVYYSNLKKKEKKAIIFKVCPSV